MPYECDVKEMKYLETERLLIRNFEAADLDELVDYRSNVLCYKYQRSQYRDRDHLMVFIEDAREDDLFSAGKKHFAVADKRSNRIIGDIFVLIKEPTISLGFTVSYKHHRQGYAYEFLSALVEAFHQRFEDYEMVACTDKENLASINLLSKLQFKNRGYYKQIDSYVFNKYAKR